VSDVEIRVLDDPAEAAAEALAEAARAGGHIALSGGTTIGAAYERAARLAPDWSRLEAWFGDERAVPPDDERSNFGLVRRTLLAALAARRVSCTGSKASSAPRRRPPATTASSTASSSTSP